MGLLTKVNDKKKSLIDKKKNQISIFLEKAESLEPGFEYSNKLLQLFSTIMEFNKSALLIPEQFNKLFIPVSYMNIDVTTLRHLRIQNTVFPDQLNSYYKNLKKNDKQIKPFKQYFSMREFSALRSIVLVPFYSNNLIKCLLLIIDPTKITLKYCREVSQISEKFILRLWKSRIPFTDNSKLNEEHKITDPILLLQGLINSIKNQNSISLLIIKLNYESLKNTIINYLPDVEPFEISNDIIMAISKLVTPNGKIYKIDSVKSLLFYKIKKGKSPDIILHQLNLAISTFFNLTESLPDIHISITEIDQNETPGADTILAGII